jgi:hypothetical protein
MYASEKAAVVEDLVSVLDLAADVDQLHGIGIRLVMEADSKD